MKCTGDRHYALLPMTVIGAIPVISTVRRLRDSLIRTYAQVRETPN
jgi:hypothetical protein